MHILSYAHKILWYPSLNVLCVCACRRSALMACAKRLSMAAPAVDADVIVACSALLFKTLSETVRDVVSVDAFGSLTRIRRSDFFRICCSYR